MNESKHPPKTKSHLVSVPSHLARYAERRADEELKSIKKIGLGSHATKKKS